ncbi:major facilitator superfamily domain-containing protein [Multifurca ochricompacta]|uniref:Major facilitator superfamily domain-containing protein n=1 Tax=Multifurca ochricompacta TaxID=376703 RepID=A0AAD4M1R4_9AGAM|nr:major facilitator superfamily domain-containing protein [Multifurca ochricompacta]
MTPAITNTRILSSPTTTTTTTTTEDIEKTDPSIERLDIEHVYVSDDPRKWSRGRKTSILCIIFSAAITAGLGSNSFNPAIKQIETDLRATSSQISLIQAMFIVFQGVTPLLWMAISEIKGRKVVYVLSLAISLIGCIVAAEAKSIGVLIGMRVVQATGSGSVIAIGAATLADIYEPSERGTMMGIFYAAPLLGPSLGPLIGGLLTQAFNWRATFWFLAAILGVDLILFTFFFHDTFRCERSLTYQGVMARRATTTTTTTISVSLGMGTNVDTGTETKGDKKENELVQIVALSLVDVNPFPPLLLVLKRWNNIAMLISSGFLFAFVYCLTYTCSRTLANNYNYDALKTGLVLLSYGIGSIFGSVLGGRWSDRELRRLINANGGRHSAEHETRMPFLPLAAVAYAWLAQEHCHIASLCVAIFFAGFFSIWIYSSALAYIVDANPGRSSAAVATNSCFRGVAAFVFTEVAVPMQDSMGDGGLFSLWAGLIVLCELLIFLVRWRGQKWREIAQEGERA